MIQALASLRDVYKTRQNWGTPMQIKHILNDKLFVPFPKNLGRSRKWEANIALLLFIFFFCHEVEQQAVVMHLGDVQLKLQLIYFQSTIQNSVKTKQYARDEQLRSDLWTSFSLVYHFN